MAAPLPDKIFRLARPLVLASQSPRRRELLQSLGIDCRMVCPPKGAEPLPLEGDTPETFAALAAKAKADAVYALLGEQDMAVLGADTVVFRAGRMFGKPVDAACALEYLQALSGGVHIVRTACHLRVDRDRSVEFYGEATVCMGTWPTSVLHSYALSGEGADKAGAYAMQGLGAFLVESISGSWSAVIGLPTAETVGVLLEHGIITPVL